MGYRIFGLDPAPFAKLFAMDDAALAEIGARRVIADEKPGFPCRVSLADAEPGEAVILVNHEHLPAPRSPYRAKGPVFVREAAGAAAVCDALPEYLRSRLLSLRAYDGEGIMLDADVVEGREAEGLIDRLFAEPGVQTIHAHFARRGCFAARIERA